MQRHRINKFFMLHNYLEKMKSKIVTFSLKGKGKAGIWWEDVKNVRGIQKEKLMWDKFERLLKNNYLSERYYDDRAKDFYELQIGSMTDDEFINRLLVCALPQG